MTLSEDIQQILNRVEKRQHTHEDMTFLRQRLLVSDPQVIQQLGKYNVNIGEGKEIHIGDCFYQQWDEQAIQALVIAIQKVNWRCVASLTEKDYTQEKYTGIGIIDKLAKHLTDFSQKSVMQYGLKLAFSPNHQQDYFISGGNQVIKRWQTTTRQMLTEISVPFSPTGIVDLWLTSVAISPDGQLIAGCKAYEINIWRLDTSNPIHTFSKTLFSNFLDVFGFDSITFSPDGKILAANDNQDIKLWDVESGKEIAKLSGHSDKVTCVAFNPKNGQILASCSYDKTIKIWDIDSKKCLGTLTAHRDAVYTLAFSPDGEILASGSNDNTIQLWYLNTAEIPQPLRKHSDGVTCLVFSPDGKTLASGSNDETMVEWNIATKELLTIFPERHPRGVTSIAFSPDNRTLISAGRDQTIKIWRRQN
jgi:WD40 repeat protein